jgi:endonuclease/exonuclease/phosphatase family metal-dependent hydrolase
MKGRYLRRVLTVFLALICLNVLWYSTNRAVSSFRAVAIYHEGKGRDHFPRFTGRLRIGAFNIAHGGGTGNNYWQTGKRENYLRRLDRIADLLSEQDLAIVVLNEIDFDSFRTGGINQAEHIAKRAGFPFRVEQRNIDAALPFVGHRYGNAVLSRFPVQATRVILFPGHSTWETLLFGKKQGLLCTIRLSENYRIGLVAVHFEHRLESTRIRAARNIEVARRRSPLPFVLAGDFNSTVVGFPEATPDEHGQTAVSWLLSTGAYATRPSGQPQETDFTSPSIEPFRVIDWILVPATWDIVSKTVIDAKLSDHLPVVMEIKVSGTSQAAGKAR